MHEVTLGILSVNIFVSFRGQLTSSLCIRVGTPFHVVGDCSQLAPLADPQP